NNFKGSEENARLYMRIAKHWSLIVEHGLDQQGMTLEDLRWFLSESPGPRPGSKPKEPEEGSKKPEGGSKKPELELETEDAQTVEPSPSQVRQVQLRFNEDDAREFEEMVQHLGEVFQTDNTTDTVHEAVRRCYKEVRHD